MRWIWTYLRTSGANFHEVVPGVLYRSATPSPENLEKWRRKYKIATWLDLRLAEDFDGDRRTPTDKSRFFERQMQVCRYLGIERVWLPISDRKPTSDESVRSIMYTLEQATKDRPLLVACQGGRHRTGLAIALYRMRVQHWPATTPDEKGAFDEAKKRGFYDERGHQEFGKRFRQLLGLALVLLMAVPAFGQGTPAVMTPENFSIKQAPEHPFIKPNQVVEPVRAEPVRNSYKFDRSFWVASGLWFGGSTADLVTTKFALDRGGVEANPLHAQDGGRKLRWTSAIAATAGTFAFSAYCERKGHRRVARIVLITGAIVRTGLAFWNNSRRR